ncbi:hypothetical protein ACWEKM_35845 [Streptomyces sp. NPDC004752]
MAVDVGLSPAQLLLIAAAQGVASVVFEVPAGVVADTLGHKPAIVTSHVLMAAAMVTTGLSAGFVPLMLAQMLWEIAWTFAGAVSDSAREARAPMHLVWSINLVGRPCHVRTAYFSNGLVAPMAGGAFILTGINTGYVNVETRVVDRRPDVDTGNWEEVIEVSVQAPAGDLKVESLELGPDSGSMHSLSPAGPAWCRLRVHARGRENLRDKVSMEPVEDYLLIVWPTPPTDTTILGL